MNGAYCDIASVDCDQQIQNAYKHGKGVLSGQFEQQGNFLVDLELFDHCHLFVCCLFNI